ncbi:hypothetical protein [Spiroplasma endosymbiont of Polydrusus pterygomalis]|uniref:hypothetical protein n=1 Tax=Spiroplasma endosymbiont of Polydrusus pterygomalis TaxID=3139327 RepID=UPI003CCABADB
MYFLNHNDDNWPWWTEFVNSLYTISIAMSMTFLILMFVSYKLFVRFCDNKNFKKLWEHNDVVYNIHYLSLNYKVRRE